MLVDTVASSRHLGPMQRHVDNKSKLKFSIDSILGQDGDDAGCSTSPNWRSAQDNSAFVAYAAKKREIAKLNLEHMPPPNVFLVPKAKQGFESGDVASKNAPSPVGQHWLGKSSAWICDNKDAMQFRRIGHPFQSRAPPKHKKPRTSFTKSQIHELEKRFGDQKYLASTERASLAKILRMTDSQVKTWFQNRRTKWRRQEAEEKEQERQAVCKYLSNAPYLLNAVNSPSYYARPDVSI